MKSHIIDDCLKIKRACRYSPFGCKFEVSTAGAHLYTYTRVCYVE